MKTCRLGVNMLESCGKLGNFELYDVTDAMRKDAIERKRCQAEGVAYYPPEFPELKQQKCPYEFVDVTDQFTKDASQRRSSSAEGYHSKAKKSGVSEFFKSIKNKVLDIKDSYKEFVENDKLRRAEQEKQLETDRAILREQFAAKKAAKNAAPKKPLINTKKIGDVAMKYVENFARGLEGMFEAVPVKAPKI